jgi:hypothetical protein
MVCFIFLFAFMQFCGAQSMNTLYFSIMNESSNSNVSVQSFNHAILNSTYKPKTKDVHGARNGST